MSTAGPYVVKRRRMGTVHIVRWYEVWRGDEHLDTYEDRDLADAYVTYMNSRGSSHTFTFPSDADPSAS